MNKLIITLIIYFFICCKAYGNPMSSGYAIAHDPNSSTVALYEIENNYSKIIQTVPNGTPMNCLVRHHNYCFSLFDEVNYPFSGNVFKRNLIFLDKDPNFQKIPLIKSNLHSAIYNKNKLTIKIQLAEKKLKKNKFRWRIGPLEIKVLFYGNKQAYGVAVPISNSVFTYSIIEIDNNGKKYSIPSKEFQGLFIEPYFVENKLFFDTISIYHNTKNDIIYIFSTQSDGALIYTSVFEFRNNAFIKVSAWSEGL